MHTKHKLCIEDEELSNALLQVPCSHPSAFPWRAAGRVMAQTGSVLERPPGDTRSRTKQSVAFWERRDRRDAYGGVRIRGKPLKIVAASPSLGQVAARMPQSTARPRLPPCVSAWASMVHIRLCISRRKSCVVPASRLLDSTSSLRCFTTQDAPLNGIRVGLDLCGPDPIPANLRHRAYFNRERCTCLTLR